MQVDVNGLFDDVRIDVPTYFDRKAKKATLRLGIHFLVDRFLKEHVSPTQKTLRREIRQVRMGSTTWLYLFVTARQDNRTAQKVASGQRKLSGSSQ
jgi:hypothetical protein